jgi:hypothetical protein
VGKYWQEKINCFFSSDGMTQSHAVTCLSVTGNVKKNRLPFPGSLSAQILPLFMVTNSLQRIKPKPVPVSLAVPSSEIFSVMVNSFFRVSGGIPIPLSSTETSR